MIARNKKTKPERKAVEQTTDDINWLTVVGARQNNLRDVTVDIPLGRFVCVTGVSGSGKSSLVNDIIRETLTRDLNGAEKVDPGECDRIDGADQLDKIIDIDQSPIGRTPRSNPATYIKIFDLIRDLYASMPDAKVRGYRKGRFSFNVHTGTKGGGRCEACEGNGSHRMEMDFLADVWVTCPVCRGHRFSKETLQILFKGKSISDVLDMDVQEALTHFEHIPKISGMLRTLHDVGLDYLKLGQSSTTLSGGEAQRIKLARELVKRSTGRTLYVLDEPTTGLHFEDIKRLLAVLHGFVDAGNSVLVIEHNLDVVKTADWVIDLGPEGGAGGGLVVATGTPEAVARSKSSYTGIALRDVLGLSPRTAPKQSKTNTGNANGSRRRDKNVISVVGARQHNLKNISVDVKRGAMSVCTGPSGSGKSSFAIDTIYSEGQRRYVESLSSYARQFLAQMQPPKVEHVHGLSPAICIEQKTTSKSPRSTVGTITEIYDYMRVLWARIGTPYCPTCRIPIGTQSSDEIVEKIQTFGEGSNVWLLAPVEPTGQESHEQLFKRLRAGGYARVRVDGAIHSLGDDIDVDNRRAHRVEVVVDRLATTKTKIARLTDSVEQALAIGQGVMTALFSDGKSDKSIAKDKLVRFSQHHSCDQCGTSYEELTPHHYSFNSRMGWCEACEGLGTQKGASASAIVVHPTKSIADGAIAGWGKLAPGSTLHSFVSALANHLGFDVDHPWNSLTEAHRLTILHGCADEWINLPPPKRVSGKKIDTTLRDVRFRWRGFFPAIHRATQASWQFRKRLEDLVTDVPCDACHGGRLRPDAAAVRLNDRSVHDVCLMSLTQASDWFGKLKLDGRRRKIAGELLHEITSRLDFLNDVGLDYVNLHRTASTLSGGESQRIQLAAQIGTGLTGVLYVLDEPTIGLHPRDNNRLIRALKRLRDLGNTLLLVEHDRDVIDAADEVLDFGPGAGDFGGHITAQASPKKLRSKRASLTGRYLSFKEAIGVPSNRRRVSTKPPRFDLSHADEEEAHAWLMVHGAREHNLKEIDVAFPLGRFTCVTGVSGSGKSTLVTETLYNALAARIHRARLVPGGHNRISGLDHVDKVINVDQSPIGNNPTSNPATYTGLFDTIRELFAKLPLSKMRGYAANRFSFNRPGGRCEACQGMGQRCIEMHFLPDVWIECESCNGTRYVPQTLEVRYRGRSISDVLKLRVTQALELFESIPAVARMLRTLDDVGLGYVPLGQSAPTLSGGEAQRVKLATELGRPSTGKTVYILDEPTTGLHFDDLRRLLGVLHRLVDRGNTVICIEHNLDVIKTADWVIDLGPEAGEAGGRIVATTTPEGLVKIKASYTGRALKPVLEAGPVLERKIDTDHTRKQTVEPVTAIAEDVKMPWEQDGRAWHTVDHCDRHGQSVGWDTKVVSWLVETIESVGSFAPTDWAHRTRIEITTRANHPWFCHILTGGKDVIEATIRTVDGTFDEARLQRHLGIKTLDERKDLPLYGQWDRVSVKRRNEGWQAIRIFIRDFTDVSKTKFRQFLKQAATAYLGRLDVLSDDPHADKPWKADGRQWHLSQRSINKQSAIRWKPATLMTWIGRFTSMQRDVQLDWDSKTAVGFQVPGESYRAAKIVTNMPRGLRIELRVPSATLTPTQIDKLGQEPTIKRWDAYDTLVFWSRTPTDVDTRQLLDVWRRCRSAPQDGRLQSA